VRIPGPEVEIMYCKYCGSEVGNEIEFCSACGKRLKNGEAHKSLYRHELTRIKPAKELKNPKAAAAVGFFMSWIFLGPVGYIYLGQWNWFWLTFIIQIFAYPLTAFFAYPLLPIVYGIHQYQMAKDVNDLIAAERGHKPAGEADVSPGEPFERPEA
jgi:hypothetical protein